MIDEGGKMRPSDGEREMIEKVHLLTGQNIETVKEVLEGVVTQIVFDFLESKPTEFPLVGKMTLEYLGDTIESGAKVAQVDMIFEPSELLLRTIGQVIDGEESEIEKLFKRKIRIDLEENANK